MSTASQLPSGGAPAWSSRTLTTIMAFVLGIPATVGLLTFIQQGPLGETEYARYVMHPVEQVEVLLFCCAVSALLTKFFISRLERRAFSADLLPAWNGDPVPVEEAGPLRARLLPLGRALRGTMLVRRAEAVLEFVNSRGSAEDLDDQMRTLADNDSISQEGSYALT